MSRSEVRLRLVSLLRFDFTLVVVCSSSSWCLVVVVDVFVAVVFVVVAVVVLTEEKSSWEKAESRNSSLVRVLLLRNDLFLASFRGRLSSISPASPASLCSTSIMLFG